MSHSSRPSSGIGSLRLPRLTFSDRDLENQFRAEYWDAVIGFSRFAIVSAGLLWIAFGALDLILAPKYLAKIWTIRFAIGTPIFVAILLLSFVPFIKKRFESWVTVATFLCGVCIIAMVAVIDPPASEYYYAGLMIVLIFGYAFVQVPVVFAAALGFGLFLVYEVVAIFLEQTPAHTLANNTFFLFATNYAGLFACYTIERYRRQNFLHVRTIEDQLKTIDSERAKLVELSAELEHISIRDPLTGLFNRRHLRQRVREALELYRRDRSPVAALLTDLDSFKTVNDRFGHPAGDELLRLTADLIRATFRRTDLTFRYGGDEFFVLLHNTTLDEACTLAQRTIDRFRELIVDNPAFAAAAGISIGVAMMDDSVGEPEQLLAAADRALYEAKQQGKAQLAVAKPSDVVTAPDRDAPPS